LIRQIYNGPQFSEELDGRYFRYYYEEIAIQITGPFKSSLWDRLIPQTGETEPYIKHAIVAIAALSKSRTSPDRDRDQTPDPHHQYALSQYSKALKGMRDAIYNNEYSLRKALMACLLVFCLESLQGHQVSASAHASSGVNLVYQWSIQQSKPEKRRPGQCAQEARLEEDLYYAFVGLDLQALLFLDSRPAQIHQSFQEGMNRAIQLMPTAFSSLKECYTYWQVIMRRNFHFAAAARAEVLGLGLEHNPSLDVESVTKQDVTGLQPGNNAWSHSNEGMKKIPPVVLEEQNRCLQDIRRWELASLQLFKQNSGSNTKTEDFFLATMLKIHAAMNVVMLASTFSPPEISYDAFLSEFRTITTLSASIYPTLVALEKGAMFHFNIGIIPALWQVGLLCRDKAVRGQAINMLLEGAGYREGVWDSEAVGHVAKFLMTIEDEGADERGFVPDYKRVSWTGGDISLCDRTSHVQYVQRTGQEEDNFVHRDAYIRW
jgi:hypothetical protein